jgi:hypothetical protein
MNQIAFSFVGATSWLVLALAAGASVAACSASGTPSGASTGGSATGGAGTGGSTKTTTTTTTTADDCTTLCAMETVACPMTTSACAALCEANKVEVTWCKAEVTAATDCLAMQPATSFQCNSSNGQPSPMSGVCSTEITAMNDCWYNGPPGGLPDQTPACMGVCSKEETATPTCYDSNCVSECEAAVAAGQKCNGAVAAYVTCSWRQPASAFACDSETPMRSNLMPGYCAFEALLVSTCLQM